MSAPVDVFFAYAPADELSRQELEKHLSMLQRSRVIRGWSSRQVGAGEEWRSAIDAKLEAAQVILLLVSADFLASDYCFDVEITRALARAEAGEALVLAVLVRAYDWGAVPFGSLPVLPTDARPVESWASHDEAWANVARGIREAVAQLAGDESAGFTRAFLRTRPIEPLERVEHTPTGTHVPFIRHRGFMGREDELDMLHARLQKGEQVGIGGMGGIGKTQLAVEYAYRYEKQYPGGVYWVNAAQDVQAAMAELARKVGLSEDQAPEAERQRRRVLAFVSFLDERPEALVIFDNVEDPASLRTEAFGFIPAKLGCRVLFTSRRRDGSGAFTAVPMGVLPEEMALAMLARGAARVLEGTELAAAREICRMLGRLPLALALAGAFLGKNAEIAVADYRDRLLEEGALAAADDTDLRDDDLPTRHKASIAATLRLDWDALANLPGGGQAERRVMQVAALLGEAAEVPRARLALLTGLAEKPVKKGYPAPLGAALRRLGELSLVEALGEETLRLHPLVREFVAKATEAPEAFAADCAGNLGEALWEMGRLNDEVAARGVDAVLDDLRVGVRLSREGEARWIERLMRPLD